MIKEPLTKEEISYFSFKKFLKYAYLTQYRRRKNKMLLKQLKKEAILSELSLEELIPNMLMEMLLMYGGKPSIDALKNIRKQNSLFFC